MNTEQSAERQELEIRVTQEQGIVKKARVLAIVMGLVVAGAVAYDIHEALHGHHLGLPNIDMPEGAGGLPPTVSGMVEPDSYQIEGTFNIACQAQIGAEVPITGKKEGPLWGAFGLTNAEIRHIEFVDAEICSDASKLQSTFTAQKTDGRITSVDATISALELFHPRVDFSDWRNNVALDPSDTAEERQKKLDAYISRGEYADQKGGFSCGGICPVSSVELINAAHIMAQYVFAIDGQQADILAELTEKYRRDTALFFAQKFAITPDDVHVSVAYGPGLDPTQPPTPEQITDLYRKRIVQAYFDALRENGADVKKFVDCQDIAPETIADVIPEDSCLAKTSIFKNLPHIEAGKDGKKFVVAELKSGAKLSVELSGMRYSNESHAAIINEIRLSNSQPTDKGGN